MNEIVRLAKEIRQAKDVRLNVQAELESIKHRLNIADKLIWDLDREIHQALQKLIEESA